MNKRKGNINNSTVDKRNVMEYSCMRISTEVKWNNWKEVLNKNMNYLVSMFGPWNNTHNNCDRTTCLMKTKLIYIEVVK